jgi:RNA polymerase sigma-70 factor (ECF subfamily)
MFWALGRGEEGALEALYDACAQSLYGYALVRLRNREDAADVVQEVFVKLMRTRARLRDVRNPGSYLLAMAHSAIVDQRRKPATEEFCDDILDTREPLAYDPMFFSRINKAMCSLSKEQREAVYLRHVEGLSLRETAAAMDTNLFTAASRCRLGLSRLKRVLEAGT